MGFDLSSKCTGVLAVEINSSNHLVMRSCSIMPKPVSPRDFGFEHSKKKLPTPRSGRSLNTFWIKGETTITEKEKKRRDSLVRHGKNDKIKAQIASDLGEIIKVVKPDIILAEKNKIFNGILTSVLLGEVMGLLEGIAGSMAIPVSKYTVEEVRAHHNTAELVKDFSARMTTDQMRGFEDVTKAALRELMQSKYGKYGLELGTYDEGDACVLIDYYLRTEMGIFI